MIRNLGESGQFLGVAIDTTCQRNCLLAAILGQCPTSQTVQTRQGEQVPLIGRQGCKGHNSLLPFDRIIGHFDLQTTDKRKIPALHIVKIV